MKKEEKPDFSKEYANKVSKADFVEHFKDVYTTFTEAELAEVWQALQEKKEAKPKKDSEK